MSNPLSRAGQAPGSFGLKGSAGLQLKAPKKYGLQKPVKTPGAATVFAAVRRPLHQGEGQADSASARVGAAPAGVRQSVLLRFDL